MALKRWKNKRLLKVLEKKLNLKPMSMKPGSAIYQKLSVYAIKRPVGMAEISMEGEGRVVSLVGVRCFVFSWNKSSEKLNWIHRPRGAISSCELDDNKLAIKPFTGKPYHLCLTTGKIVDA